MPNPQEIKEEALAKNDAELQKNNLEKPLPKLKLSDDELDIFAKSLATGKPFSKKFFHPQAVDFVLELRDKTKKEGEIIGRSLDRSMDSKKILNWVEYTHAFNMVSLYYQIESINGITHNREYPESVYKNFDVLDAMERSPIADWTSSQIYIAMGFMFQFNQALLEVSQRAFDDENFS